MTCKNTEIKKLKKAIKAMRHLPGRVGLLPDFAESLLARLEAAEAYIDVPSLYCQNCGDTISSSTEQNSAYKDWKASKGEL